MANVTAKKKIRQLLKMDAKYVISNANMDVMVLEINVVIKVVRRDAQVLVKIIVSESAQLFVMVDVIHKQVYVKKK